MAGLVAGETLAVVWVVAKTLKIYPFEARLTWGLALIPPILLAAAHAALVQPDLSGFLARVIVFAAAALGLVTVFVGAVWLSKLAFVPPFVRRRMTRPW
jgi:hypothetical protein